MTEKTLDAIGLPSTAQVGKTAFRPHTPPRLVPDSDAIRSLKCRHGCDDAILGIFHFPKGCICFDDPIQALCLYHFLKAEQNLETPITPLVTFAIDNNSHKP